MLAFTPVMCRALEYCNQRKILIAIFLGCSLCAPVLQAILLQAVVAHPRSSELQCNFVCQVEAGDMSWLTPPSIECIHDEKAVRRDKLERLGETNLLVRGVTSSRGSGGDCGLVSVLFLALLGLLS